MDFPVNDMWRCRAQASATGTIASRTALMWLSCVDVPANDKFANAVAVVSVCLKWGSSRTDPSHLSVFS